MPQGVGQTCIVVVLHGLLQVNDKHGVSAGDHEVDLNRMREPFQAARPQSGHSEAEAICVQKLGMQWAHGLGKPHCK